MSQQIRDLLESCATLHELHGQRMAQDVRATDAGTESASGSRIAHCIADDAGVSGRIEWRAVTDEDLAPFGRGAAILQVGDYPPASD